MKINRVHRAVAEALFAQRLTPDDIHTKFKVKPERLAQWLEEPEFQAVLRDIEARYRRRARWLFLAFAESAAARLIRLLDCESDETARKASIDVLEHAHLGAVTSGVDDETTAALIKIDAEMRTKILVLLNTPGTGALRRTAPLPAAAPPVQARLPFPDNSLEPSESALTTEPAGGSAVRIRMYTMPELTMRQTRALLEGLRRTAPETEDELHGHIRYFLGLSVPRLAVCKSHCAPFAYVAGAFFGTLGDCVIWAPRAGGKTANGAVVTLLECLHRPDLGVRILGGSREQSEKMHQHMTALLAFEPRHGVSALEADLVDGEPLIGGTRFRNGSETAILTQSAKSVRGPHVPRLRLDEVDEFDPEIFQAALKITQSMRGHRGRTEIFSTMHRRFGLMADLVREHEARRFTLLKWCLWEVIEPCRDRTCSQCEFHGECGGRAKRADGYYAIDDAIRLWRHSSTESWDTEMLCKRPSLKGLVYAAFNRDVHVREFARNPNWPTYAAFDFGFENPFVCLFLQLDRDGRIWVFEEYCESGKPTYEHGEALKERFARYGIRRAWGDPSGADERATLNRMGLPVAKAAGTLAAGIEEIRRRLKAAPETGQPRLLVSARCPNLIREFETYHYPDPREGANANEEPVKADDHALDALRYAVVALRGHAPVPELPRVLRPRVFAGSGARLF